MYIYLMKKKIFFLIFIFSIFSAEGQEIYYKILPEESIYRPINQGEIGDLITKGSESGDNNKRLFFLEEAYKLTKTKKDSTLLPYIYFNYADTYLKLSNNEKIFFYLNKVIELVSWDSHNYLLSRVYNYIGFVHQLNDNFDLAILNYKTILKKTKYQFSINLANANITEIYINNQQYEIAKIYIDSIFEYYLKNTKEGENHKELAFMYLYLTYYTDSVKEKIKFVDKGVLLTKNRPIHNKVTALQFRAKFYSELNNFELAIDNYNEILYLLDRGQLDYKVASVYHDLAKLYLDKRHYEKTIIQLDSARKYIKKNNLKLKIKNTTLYYTTYELLKDFQSAYFFIKQNIKLRDSIKSITIDSLYIAYGKKYQTEKKIQENELLKKENKIQELEVKKQTTNRNYLLLFSVMGLIMLGVTYNRFRLKRKTANALASQNAIIGNQKIELEKSNENKQKLFGIVAHDLVNPFNAILGYTKLLDDDYDSFNEEERKQFISIINTYATNNYKLTRTLLDWAKVQQDRLVVKKTKLNCKNIVQEAIQPYLVLADKKQIQINTYIPEHTFIEADKNMMQTVIGNLVVNAIKFTTEKGKINLHLYKNKDGTVNLEIKDNGIGMSQEQLNNLFDITKINTLNGTNNEKGNGLGLILCKELMELQQGSLQLFSKRNTGSRAIVTI